MEVSPHRHGDHEREPRESAAGAGGHRGPSEGPANEQRRDDCEKEPLVEDPQGAREESPLEEDREDYEGEAAAVEQEPSDEEHREEPREGRGE